MVGDPAGRPIDTPPTSTRRLLLGELLVDAGVITRDQLAEALAIREPGKKLGQLLVERGFVTEAQVTQTLSLQLSVPWVSLYHIDFSRQLLNRVPRELAERFCLVPIFVRHVKGQGETLYVAMDDPTNDAALAEVSKIAGLPARPMVASASDIRSAIRVYYGDSSPSLVADVPAARSKDAPVTTREGEAAPRGSVPPEATKSRPDSDEIVPVTTRSSPPTAKQPSGAPPAGTDVEQRRRGASKLVNLTLLDGTTIQLPPRPKKKNAFVPDEGLTTRDLISALRATTHGADATEILGEKPHWEPVVAALLSVLLRKGLIADWEFVEELRKI